MAKAPDSRSGRGHRGELALGRGLISRQTPDLRGPSFDLLSDGSALEVGGDADTLIGPAGADQENAGLSFSLSDVVLAVARVPTPATAGSRVVIDTGGSLLTNAHLVRGYSQVTVILPDRQAVVGEVVRLDEVRDLALVSLPGERYPETWVTAAGPSLSAPGKLSA